MDEKNFAFIDGQNLFMGTSKSEFDPWKINLSKLRVYLKNKYKIEKAFYFLGFIQENHQEIYENIQNAGFILVFRQHNIGMYGKKKGNVDSDIVFHVMKKLYKKEGFHNVVLVSGDGDYKLLVDFLIEEQRFKKILFPNRKFASSLYKEITNQYFSYLDDKDIKNKII